MWHLLHKPRDPSTPSKPHTRLLQPARQPKQLAQQPSHRAYSARACIAQHPPTPYALYVIHPDAALVLEGSCARTAAASRAC